MSQVPVWFERKFDFSLSRQSCFQICVPGCAVPRSGWKRSLDGCSRANADR